MIRMKATVEGYPDAKTDESGKVTSGRKRTFVAGETVTKGLSPEYEQLLIDKGLAERVPAKNPPKDKQEH